MTELPWDLVLALSTTGVFMALLSSLIGMRPKVENPLWWAVYAVWIAIVVTADRGAPFLTILVASPLAGLWHGTTQAILLTQYKRNNPWHAEKMRGSRPEVLGAVCPHGCGSGHRVRGRRGRDRMGSRSSVMMRAGAPPGPSP